MTMNWEDLRYFQATAESGNYTSAANRLGVNRTTVSRRVEALEQRLGTALLLWQSGQMQLSDAGEQVLRLCQQWQSDSEQLLNGLELGQQLVAGKLRIAAPLGLGPEFMPELASLNRHYPELEWELLNSLDPAQSLRERQADIALYLGDQPPIGTRGKHLGDLHRAVYGSQRYLSTQNKPYQLNQLAWLRWGSDMPASKINRWLNQHISEDNPCPARLNSWQAMKEAVISGLGIAHLWVFLADDHPELQRLAPIETSLTMGLWLLQRSDLATSVKLDAVEHRLSEAINQRLSASVADRGNEQ